MELHYTLTQEDYLAFALFHHQNDANSKQKISRVGIWVMAFVLVIMLYVFKVPTQSGLLVAAAVMVVWFFLAPLFYKWFIPFRLQGKIKTGQYTPALGNQTLVLLPKALSLTGLNQTKEYAFEQIRAIKEDGLRLYLYTGDESALMIPLAAFKNEEEKKLFIQALKSPEPSSF